MPRRPPRRSPGSRSARCSSSARRSSTATRPPVYARSSHDRGGGMPTYLMLTTLTEKGVQTLKSNPGRLREVNRDIEELGARVLHQWASLGEYDFVNIVEAPDDVTVAKVSVALGARGSAKLESLPLVSIDDLLASLEAYPSGPSALHRYVNGSCCTTELVADGDNLADDEQCRRGEMTRGRCDLRERCRHRVLVGERATRDDGGGCLRIEPG